MSSGMEGISSSIIDFSAYVQERTRDFTGRDWVFAEIDHWLANPEAPQSFLLIGEPGSGKTAIASRLVQFSDESNSPDDELDQLQPKFLSAYHFCSARDSLWISPYSFAQSLALQLAKRYPVYAESLAEQHGVQNVEIDVNQRVGELKGGQVIGVYFDVSREEPEDAFIRLVRDPLEVLSREDEAQRITILVDALDEALVYSGEIDIVSLLAQSEGLPANVRLLLTTRSEERIENEFLEARHLYLSSEEFRDRNQVDTQAYVKLRIGKDETLASQTIELGLGKTESTIEEIVEKTDGNFRYVTFLMDAIAGAQQSLSDLDVLPPGLDGLYSLHLDRLVDIGKKNWAKDYAPIMGVLSVAQESLSEDQLAAFTSQSKGTLWEALGNLLGQFIEEVDRSEPHQRQVEEAVRYRLYHQSVADFLNKSRIRLVDQKSKRNSYYLPAEEWHRKIAYHYWDNFLNRWGECDEYGLNHLAGHLFNAEETGRLSDLINEGWMRIRRERDGNTFQGFLHDVDLAFTSELRTGQPDPLNLVRLSTASIIIRHQVSSFSDTDLKTLVRLGRVDEALSHAHIRNDAFDRIMGFIVVNREIKNKKEEYHWIFHEAIMSAGGIQEEFYRAIALIKIAYALTEAEDSRVAAMLDDVLQAVWEIQDQSNMGMALREMPRIMAEAGRLEEALEVAGGIQDESDRAIALKEMASLMAEADQIGEVLQAAREFQKEYYRASVLSDVARVLALVEDPRAEVVVDEAQQAADEILDESERGSVLREVARALGYYEQALPIFEEVGDRAGQANPLKNIGRAYKYLGQQERALEYFKQALTIDKEVGDRPGQAATLNNIGLVYRAINEPQKALEYFEQALPICEEEGDRAEQSVTLNNIGGVYANLGQREKAVEYFVRAVSLM